MKLIILIVWATAYPTVKIEVGRFETEKQCHAAFKELDASTEVVLKYDCRVRT